MTKTPNEAMVVIQCSRCDGGGVGKFVREGDQVMTLGFAFPMGHDENGRPLAERFKPDEVVLCQACMTGSNESEPEPDGAPVLQLVKDKI